MITRNKLPDVSVLKDLLHYDHVTGVLVWKNGNGRRVRAGDLFGHNRQRYIRGYINGKAYYAHRIVWKLVHEEEPPDLIDHINHDTHDNRAINLRESNYTDNNRVKTIKINNTSGCTGVSFVKHTKKWQAYITVDKTKHNLGHYTEVGLAIEARKQAEEDLLV